jgi:hypothetical protein
VTLTLTFGHGSGGVLAGYRAVRTCIEYCSVKKCFYSEKAKEIIRLESVIWTTLGVGVNKIVKFVTPNKGLRRVECEKLFVRQQ